MGVSCNTDFFREILTPEQAYVLGFVVADGCVVERQGTLKGVSLCAHARDHGHLEAIRAQMGSGHRLARYTDPAGVPMARLVMSQPQLAEDLGRLGIGPRKTFTVKWPYLREELTHHFVRGVFDGDGTVYSYLPKGYRTPQVRVSFCGASLHFMETLRDVVAYDAGLNLTKVTTVANYYMVGWGGNPQVRRFAEWLYAGSTIHMQRKRDKFAPLLD